MEDNDILGRIHELVEEEHALRERHGVEERPTDDDRRRLQSLEVALDQCWDLLRQRKARLDAGQNPDEARARPGGEVEDYLQ